MSLFFVDSAPEWLNMPHNTYSIVTKINTSALDSHSTLSLYGSLLSLKILSNTDDVKKWICEKYPSINQTDLFQGYKFIIETLSGIFLRQILPSPGIEEDNLFAWVYGRDIDLEKQPSTCAASKLFSVVNKQLRKIRRSKSFDEISKNIADYMTEIISPFFEHCNNYMIYPQKYSKEEVVTFSFLITSLCYIFDSRHGCPLGYTLSPANNGKRLDGKKIDKSLCGYLCCFEYLLQVYYPVQKTEEFVTHLHLCQSWKDVDTTMYTICFNEFKDWDIYNEYLKTEKGFRLEQAFSRSELNTILKSWKSPELSLNERLDACLWWTDIGFLDASGTDFSGHRTLLSLLYGEIQLHQMLELDPQDILVVRFRHPTGIEGQHYYSYGIMLDGDINLRSSSGWIISYSCATDFSGTGGAYHDIIESALTKYSQYLSVETFDITEDEFKKYLMNWDCNSESFKLREKATLLKIAEDSLAEARGLLTELLIYYLESENILHPTSENKSVEWNVGSSHNNQLDLVCSDDKQVSFFECKVSLDTINVKAEFEKLVDKMKKYDTSLAKVGYFVFYHEPSSKKAFEYGKYQLEYLEKGIRIENPVIIEELLHNGETLNVKLDKIKKIFGECPKEEEEWTWGTA